MNKILENKPNFAGKYFAYHMPKWAAQTLKGVFLLFGISTLYLVILLQTTTPAFVIGFMYFLSGCFLLVGLHPKTGQEKTYFICNNQGIYFPSYQSHMLFPHGKSEMWLFVPWTNINNIEAGRLIGDEGQVKGISFSLNLTKEEENIFFPDVAVRKQNHLGNVDTEGNLIVGYSNIFQRVEVVVSILRQFSNQA